MGTDDSNARRAELRRQYKETPRTAGIFAIKDRQTGKLLVLASPDVPGAINGTRFQLEAGAFRQSDDLQRDWKQLGGARFDFEILDTLPPPKEPGVDLREELEALRGLWLERLKPFGERGYNVAPK